MSIHKIQDRAAGALMGAFVGDALALGPHWYYDLAELRRDFGDWIDDYTAPKPGRYHEGLKAGQLSQAGFILELLLRSLVECGGYEGDDFCRRMDVELFPLIDGPVDPGCVAQARSAGAAMGTGRGARGHHRGYRTHPCHRCPVRRKSPKTCRLGVGQRRTDPNRSRGPIHDRCLRGGSGHAGSGPSPRQRPVGKTYGSCPERRASLPFGCPGQYETAPTGGPGSFPGRPIRLSRFPADAVLYGRGRRRSGYSH